VATVKVRIEGADKVARNLRKLPQEAQEAMRDQAKDIAVSLTDWVKADGRAHSRQGARAAQGIREGAQGLWPVITGSNTGRRRGGLQEGFTAVRHRP
jgi:hypothetical protein